MNPIVCISDIPACVTPSMVTSTITGTVTSLSDAAYTTNNDVFTTVTQIATSLLNISSTGK